MPSDHETNLSAEGYGGARFGFELAAWHALGSKVGLGVEGGWRMRSSDGKGSNPVPPGFPEAPKYEESIVLGGAILPLRFGGEPLVLIASPILGVGAGKAEFYDKGAWRVGPLLGANVELYITAVHLGIDFGVDTIPVRKPGAADGSANFGMIYTAITVGLDVQ